MSKIIEKLETPSQTWTNVTLYQNIGEAANAGLSFMHNDKEGAFHGSTSNEGGSLEKVGFVPYRGYYNDYLKIAKETEPVVIQKHDKAYTAKIDLIEVTVLDGEMSEAEMKAYVDRARTLYPKKPIKGMTLSVIDSNFVDIKYNFDITPFQRTRRVTGYLADEHRMNNAKHSEVRDRVKHDVSPTMDFEDVYIDEAETGFEPEM